MVHKKFALQTYSWMQKLKHEKKCYVYTAKTLKRTTLTQFIAIYIYTQIDSQEDNPHTLFPQV